MNIFLASAKNSHDCVKDYVYSNNIGRLPTDEEVALYDKIDPENSNFHHRRRNGEVGCDIAKATERVSDDFEKIEKALEGKEWIANEFSLADMAWFPNTIIFRQCGYDFSDMPNVMAWIKRMESRKSYREHFGRDIEKNAGMDFSRVYEIQTFISTAQKCKTEDVSWFFVISLV